MDTRKIIRVILLVQCVTVLCLFALTSKKEERIINVKEIPMSVDAKEVDYDIVLDAGHGGYDSGAFSGDLLEKDVTLSMTKKIGDYLEKKGISVQYVRENDDISWAKDEISDLNYRCKVASESNAKIMVSIHVNSDEGLYQSSGYEIWYDSNDQCATKFSENILNRLSKLAFAKNRGLKDIAQSPLHLINFSEIPTIIFEVGFIESNKDQVYLNDGKEQKQFCEQVALGILDALK